MKAIAVVGAGISGLVTAYLLSRRHTVWLFERADRLGGHTNTVRVTTPAGQVALDTGFIVFNTRTYPNLCRLFHEVGIASRPSDMSFSVACPATGIEYSSRGPLGFFAQPSSVIRPDHYRLLRDIVRFNREAPEAVERADTRHCTVDTFVRRERYSEVFVDRYLIPMTSAIWSAPASAMRSFPVATIVRFMQNHGMLSLNTRLVWRVVAGGSDSYIAPLVAPLAGRVQVGVGVTAIRRDGAGVQLSLSDARRVRFDEVVVACHGDQVLGLLADPTELERRVFTNFVTTRNHAVLHTDAGVLPTNPRARASWNYRLADDAGRAPSVTYDLNRLQGLPCGTPQYCVTLNPLHPIDEARVLQRIDYCHPQFTADALRAQSLWRQVSGVNRTHFAGAYWRHGFHEDGVVSAQRVAADLGVSW